MAFWKQKHNQTDGFSLVEVVVSITILGIIAVPMLTSLLDSYRLNLRSDDRLQAQLAVSSAVETIMAEGFNPSHYEENAYEKENPSSDPDFYHNRFPLVLIEVTVEPDTTNAAYGFSVTSAHEEDIFVTTYARPYNGGDGT